MKGDFTPTENIEKYLDNSFNIQIYSKLEVENDPFKPLDFFNMFYEQAAIILANKDRPLAVKDHLSKLELNESQRHFHLYYLLRFFDSYDIPIQTRLLYSITDNQMRCCRGLIEEEYERLDKKLYPDPEIDILDRQNATLPDSNAETEFSQHDVQNTSENVKVVSTASQDDIQDPPKPLIAFNTQSTLNRVFDMLKAYFPDREGDFKKALEGEGLESSLLFEHAQNQLVEVFRRLKYNGFIPNTLTEIKEWLCLNFQFRFRKGSVQEVRSLNPNTVWDILSKGIGEPTKKSRICKDDDWLPYKSPNTLKYESQEEKN